MHTFSPVLLVAESEESPRLLDLLFKQGAKIVWYLCVRCMEVGAVNQKLMETATCGGTEVISEG